MEDLGVEKNSDKDKVNDVLPLPYIHCEILMKAIDWYEQHKNEPETVTEVPLENPEAKASKTKTALLK